MSTALRLTPPRVQSGGAHFERFCATYCRHTKGPLLGRAMNFEAWQRRAWREALRLNKGGERTYQFVLLGRPRKNYKTTECAALGLYLAGPDGEPAPEVAIGSGSFDQAGFVFNQAVDFVKASPSLRRWFRPQLSNILSPAMHGVLRRVSSEGRLQLGSNLSAAIIDELHVFRSERERDLYTALVTASGIREQPLVVAITTAGWDKHTLLGELFGAALELPDVERFGRYEELTLARDPDAGFLMLWYGPPEGADIEDRGLWRAVNPGRTVRMDYLERQWRSPAISEGEFRRYHLNEWTASVERWISDSIWRSAAAELRPEDMEGSEVYLAVDAALTYDTTACDMAFPLANGRVLHVARVWSARADAPHDVLVPGGRIDNSLVEEYVRSLAQRFAVRELVYDPRYFEDVANRLARAGVRTAPMQPGTALMHEATSRFYVDVQEGRVLHLAGPAGAVLTSHVEAAAAIKTETGWRLSKLRAARPIDALIAMVMAHSRAARRHESVYERRGLLVLGEEAAARRAQRESLVEEEEEW